MLHTIKHSVVIFVSVVAAASVIAVAAVVVVVVNVALFPMFMDVCLSPGTWLTYQGQHS